MVGNVITAVVTLSAVALGGLLSIRGQDRFWRRDHARQWRDIRLATYADLVTAYRNFVTYAVEPDARISAVQHPQRPDDRMPFFDASGRPYKEKLDAARTAARLVAEREETAFAIQALVNAARRMAAARADLAAEAITRELWDALWVAERGFLLAARRELGLAEIRLSMYEGARGLESRN